MIKSFQILFLFFLITSKINFIIRKFLFQNWNYKRYLMNWSFSILINYLIGFPCILQRILFRINKYIIFWFLWLLSLLCLLWYFFFFFFNNQIFLGIYYLYFFSFSLSFIQDKKSDHLELLWRLLFLTAFHDFLKLKLKTQRRGELASFKKLLFLMIF